MTMHRRPVGRSRLLAAIGALLVLGGCFLPWWTVGGTVGLPTRSGNAFDSLGIVVFAGAIATLALVTLPYASERPVKADRWSSYAIITVVAWLAFGYRVVDLALLGAFRFGELAHVVTRIPGLWLAFVGLVVMARATYEMLGEPRLR